MICDSVIAKQFPSYKQLKQLPPTCEKMGRDFCSTGRDTSSYLQIIGRTIFWVFGQSFCGNMFIRACANNGLAFCVIQIRRSKQTLNVKHPMDLQIPLPDLLLRAVATVLTLGPGAVAEQRAAHCSRILKRIKELETEEKALHENFAFSGCVQS